MSIDEKKKARSVTVPPFEVEVHTPRNQDIMVQCLGNMRLRGAVRSTVDVFDKQWLDDDEDQDAEDLPTRSAPARLIEGISDLPGMRIMIHPGELKWKVYDPLHKKEKTFKKIKRAMKRAFGVISVGDTLGGVKPRMGVMDEHTMKSFIREILCFIISEEVRVVKGVAPSIEDVNALPGRYLLNNSNVGNWHQPRFEDQYNTWVDDMNRIS